MLLGDIKNVTEGLYIVRDRVVVNVSGGWVLEGGLTWKANTKVNKLFSIIGVYLLKDGSKYTNILVEDVNTKIIKIYKITDLSYVYAYLDFLDKLIGRVGSNKTMYTFCYKLLNILNLSNYLELIRYDSSDVIGILDITKGLNLIRLYTSAGIHKDLGEYVKDIVYTGGVKLFVTCDKLDNKYLVHINSSVDIIRLDNFICIKAHFYNSILLEFKDYTLLFISINNKLYYSVVTVQGINKDSRYLEVGLSISNNSLDIFENIEYLTTITNKSLGISVIGIDVKDNYIGSDFVLENLDVIYKDSYICIVNRCL